MKTTFLLSFISFILAVSLQAQVVLDYSTHAPIAGDNIYFSEVNFIEPGQAGKDLVWDFSNMIFTGKDVQSQQSLPTNDNMSKFSHASQVVLTEENKDFYFSLNSKSYDLVGLLTEDFFVTYETPVAKLAFPFTFNDYKSHDVKGHAVFSTDYHIDIYGTHSIEADAYGLMILPGNRIKNVIRIKQYTKTTQVSMCDIVEVDAYKYFWYAHDERYPLISTTVREERFSRGETKHIQETYVNERVFSCASDDNLVAHIAGNDNAFNYTVFPNPFKNDINISYQLNKNFKVSVSIYDVLGKNVKDIVFNENQSEGIYTYTIGASDIGLNPGIYFVKLEFDNKVLIEKIIRSH